MKKLMIVIVSALSLTACNGAPSMRRVPPGNTNITVDVIAVFDNLRLYRVKDGPVIVYVAGPLNGNYSLATQWNQSCGDDCTETVRVQTVAKK